MSIRTVHIGFYSPRATKILSAVHEYVLSRFANYRHTEKTRSTTATKLVVADDGEAIYELSSFYYNGYSNNIPFNKWSDARVLEHFAYHYKDEIRKRYQNVKWDRYSADQLTFGNVTFTMSEFYYIYDVLKGRKTAKFCYRPDAKVEELIGTPLDPITTEMKIAQKEEIKKVKDALQLKLQALEHERYAKQDEMRKKIYNEYEDKKNVARVEAEKKIADLEAELEAIHQAALGAA